MTDIEDVPPVPDRTLADGALVRVLIGAQFPQWSGLRIRPVDDQGWDNRTFRLGDDMLVRLPTADEYALAVEKEQRWLPIFARSLPQPIPAPLALGLPSEEFPHRWSVYRWLDGSPVDQSVVDDMTAFAADLAAFLLALQQIDPTGGPEPGLHNWFRGGPVGKYDQMARQALLTLKGVIYTDIVGQIWERAIAAPWDGRPVWFHGDVASGNLLVRNGALAGVIDFGTCGIGDPACDLAVAWTLLSGESRDVFRERLGVDDATWLRGQGWALWKALVSSAGALEDGDDHPAESLEVIDQIVTANR